MNSGCSYLVKSATRERWSSNQSRNSMVKTISFDSIANFSNIFVDRYREAIDAYREPWCLSKVPSFSKPW